MSDPKPLSQSILSDSTDERPALPQDIISELALSLAAEKVTTKSEAAFTIRPDLLPGLEAARPVAEEPIPDGGTLIMSSPFALDDEDGPEPEPAPAELLAALAAEAGESPTNRTRPFDRARLFGAPPPPTAADVMRHSSIAPLAFDVPPGAIPQPDAPLLTVATSNAPLIAGAVAGGLALSAALVIGFFALRAPLTSAASAVSESRTPAVAQQPREARSDAPRTAVIESPESAPQKAEPSARSRGKGDKGEKSAPAPTAADPDWLLPTPPASPAQAAAPAAPEPPARPAAQAATTRDTTGVIQVPSSLMTVMVDGDYKRVHGGRVVVSCGRHKINAGRGTQAIDVPCGGVVTAN